MKYFLAIFSIIFLFACSKSKDELNRDDHLFFKTIKIEDGSINGWDQFDSADMQLILSGDSETYFLNTIENVDSFHFANWSLDTLDLQASDFRWTLEIRDIDDFGFEEMVKFTFNPFLRWHQLRDEDATQIDFYHEQWHIIMSLKQIP